MEREITGVFGRYRSVRNRLGRILSSISRYDLWLAAIPAAFVLSVLVATTLGVSLEVAMLGAAVVGAAVLVDALFWRPPTEVGGRGPGGPGTTRTGR